MGASLLINARAETATEKPTFRTLARETRCVLPASGYYEWTKADSEKNPHFISSDLQKTLFWSFAGLVRVTEEDGELKQETVILTKPATPQLESIHHRMPVLLAPEQVQDWLNPNLSFPLDLAMAAGNSENIETRRVSTKLNHVGAEGADLLNHLLHRYPVNPPSFSVVSCTLTRFALNPSLQRERGNHLFNRILDNVWMWSEYQSDRGFCFNGFALVCGDTVLVIDPVGIGPQDMLALQSLGRRFEIVLLNADHEREADAFADALSAHIWAPKTDVALLKSTKRVQTYGNGHIFGDDWEVKHLLGMKTPGESALYNERRGILLVGDAILADPAVGLRLVPKQKLKDTQRALKALEGLTSLEFELCCAVMGSNYYMVAKRHFVFLPKTKVKGA